MGELYSTMDPATLYVIAIINGQQRELMATMYPSAHACSMRAIEIMKWKPAGFKLTRVWCEPHIRIAPVDGMDMLGMPTR